MTVETAQRAMAWVMLAFVILWTASAFLAHQTPPLDILEGLIWGNEWLWGTEKHPPLPAWLIEISWQIGGMIGVYFLASAALALGLWFVFLLGCRFVSVERAFLGALLLLGLFYYLWPVPEFNHNTAQIPLWAAVIFLFERCLTDRRIHFWLLLGMAAALCVLTKYTSLFLLFCVPVWLLLDGEARRQLWTFGPWASLFLFLALIAPHLNFLVQNDFSPWVNALERASEGHSVFWFLLAQGFNHLPMILILGMAGFFGRGAMMSQALSRADRFLLFFAFAPLILFAAVLGVSGAGFRSMWGAPFFMLSGLLLMRFFGARWTEARARRIVYGASALLVLAPLCYSAVIAGRSLVSADYKREHWPQSEISAQVERHYRAQAADRPLKVIVGRVEIAGLAAMGIRAGQKTIRARPSVLIEGDFAVSPWIKKDNICRATIIIWKGTAPQEEFQSIIALCDRTAKITKLEFPIAGFQAAKPLILHMVVLAEN